MNLRYIMRRGALSTLVVAGLLAAPVAALDHPVENRSALPAHAQHHDRHMDATPGTPRHATGGDAQQRVYLPMLQRSGTSTPTPTVTPTPGSTSVPTVTGFTPVSGALGTVVTINGSNLSGATAVKFNGAPATTISNVTTSSLKAIVPSGATTGKISVTTPGGTASSSADFAVTTASARELLLGTSELGEQIDTNPGGRAEAFVYTAQASGTATELQLYLDASSTATLVIAGLYSDVNGSPGTLLASATLSTPQAGAWNAMSLPSLEITAGQKYWIALMAPPNAGTIRFRDLPAGGDTTVISSQTNLTALPTTWSNGARYDNSPASAYLLGVTSSTPTSTPTPTPSASPTPTPTPIQTPVPGQYLDTHQVVVDGGGKLMSWVIPQDKAYDRVSSLSWDLLLNKIPADPSNGLKVYFTHSEYDPDTLEGVNYPNNPAGKNAMLAESALLYYAYSGNRAVLDLVRSLLDHQLTYGTTPSNYVWSNVPWSTGRSGSITYGNDDAIEGVGVLEPDKVGELGFHGYLRFWQITGDTRYRDAAIACADALAANIRQGNADQSPWPFRVDAKTGQVVEEYTAHTIAPIRLLDELIRLNLGHVDTYRQARQLAWDWLMTYPMVNNYWTQYFEDVGRSASQTSNLNQYIPGQTARYLLEHPEMDPNWRTKVQGLITWIEDHFGGNDSGEPGIQYGARVISEQDRYRYKMASHTSRYAAVNALYAAATGDLAAKDKAFRSLNWATYMARDSGAVNEGPAESRDNPPFWFTDGHGDYIRHFMLAMGAFPEWAPSGENHLVRSSSVVTPITYAASGIIYQTFDAAATEAFRLASAPTSVLADGAPLPRRTDLSAPGWMYDSASGVLRVRHDSAKQIQVVF